MLPKTPYRLNKTLDIKILKVGKEQQKVIVIDDLLKHPDALVNFAITHQFTPYPTPQPGTGYPGVRLTAPAEYSSELMSFLRELLVTEFQQDPSIEMRKAECCLSLTTKQPEELGQIQLTPHFDTSNYNQFAILLYLCQQEHGGTAFYRHNKTGFETVTPDRSNTYMNIYFSELKEIKRQQAYFTESDEQFTKINHIDAQFNRLVIYRSCLIHSPYISNPDISVSSDPATGRLTANSFVAF